MCHRKPFISTRNYYHLRYMHLVSMHASCALRAHLTSSKNSCKCEYSCSQFLFSYNHSTAVNYNSRKGPHLSNICTFSNCSRSISTITMINMKKRNITQPCIYFTDIIIISTLCLYLWYNRVLTATEGVVMASLCQ